MYIVDLQRDSVVEHERKMSRKCLALAILLQSVETRNQNAFPLSIQCA